MSSTSSPLFALGKSTKPHLPVVITENRAYLYGDQAALRIEICNLGTLDELLETKQELQEELSTWLVDNPLKQELQDLIQKIQSLHQFYVPSQGATKTHIKEMMGRLEKVQQPLTLQKAEKVRMLLFKLNELYRQAQNQLEKESPEATARKFECTLVGVQTGYRYVTQEIMDQLVPISKEGAIKRSIETGSRPVNQHGDIYWKVRPSAPLCEKAFHLLGKISSGISSAPSEFVILQRKIGPKNKTLYTQASRAATGIGMHKVLREYPEWIVKFDPVLYGYTTIFHMLGNPQDAKPDNFIVIPEKNKDGDFLSASWKGIDEDQSFAHPLCISASGIHFINVRSIFFCLPQVYQPIHPQVQQHFSAIAPATLTLQWLLELWEANQSVVELWKQGHISAKKMQKMQLPFYLLDDWVPTLYDKLLAIQNFMSIKTSGSTYMDLLKKVVPELGYYYDLTNRKYPGDPTKAFTEVFGANSYEEAMQSMLGLPLVSHMPLSQYLQKSKHKIEDFEVLRNTTPEKAAEQFLERLNFATLLPREQADVLKILHEFPLTHITLRNCSSIDDNQMLHLVRSQPQLRSLKLINCPNLTDATLQFIPLFHRRIKFVIQECPGFSAEALASVRGFFQQVDVSDRRESVRASSGIFKDEMSEAHEIAMHELSLALDKDDWKQVKENIAAFTEKSWVPQATILIVERLLTTDAMTTIVKNNQRDVLEFFLQLSIPLSQRNGKGETFLHLCCEENNSGLLKWLCSQPLQWKEIATPKGFTPCHTAAKNKDTTCLEILIGAKAPINSPSQDKITPLHLAILHSLPAAKLLIQAGGEPHEGNFQGKTSLHLACQVGHEELVSLLLEKSPTLLDIRDWNGRVPLFTAIESKSLSCCKLLCVKMKSIDPKDHKKMTPLMFAVQMDPQIAQLLLSKGADMKATDEEGMTAAHIATLAGAFESMMVILGNNPSAESLSLVRKDKKGLLHLASISGNERCVRWLCERGMSMTQKDEREMTPPHYAAAAGRWSVLSVFISKGFPVEYQDSSNRETCLMLALKGHHFELVEKLLPLGASLTRDNWGSAPIHTAAKEGDSELIRYLCGKEKTLVSFPSQNDKKSTPLHLAAAGGQFQTVETLLSLGAPVDARDRDGKTPLHFAFQNGHEKVAKFLIQHGANITLPMNGGWTCLHYAAKGSFPQLVEYALSLHPATISARTNPEGHTPLHTAMYQEDPQPSKTRSTEQNQQKSLQRLEVIKILLRYGADVDALDNFDYVPLHLAARNGRLDFANLLINRGARKDIRNKNGNTPHDQGVYAAAQTSEEEKKKAILMVTKFLEEQTSIITEKKAISSQDKTLAPLMQKTFVERKKTLLSQIKEDEGFRRESLLLTRSLEIDISESAQESQNFRQELSTLFLLWKQTPPHVFSYHVLGCEWSKMNAQQMLDKYLQQPSSQLLDEWICLLPFISSVSAVLQVCIDSLKSKNLSENHLQAIAQLIQHLQSHEAFSITDFPLEVCSTIAKILDKNRKGPHKELVTAAKDFISDPKSYFHRPHADTDWKRSVLAERRQKLLPRLNSLILEKPSSAEKEAFIDQLTLSVLRMNKEWFLQLHLSDFRHSILPSQPSGSSTLTELKRTSKDLTGNCLIFLFHETDSKKFLKQFEFVIDWTARCLHYGDFHQAFALYRALSHPAVLRIQKARKKLELGYCQQLAHFEALFSPISSYQNYFSHLHRFLSPAIPAFEISLRLLSDNPILATTYALLRQTQECRSFAKRLILPTPNHFSEYQLFLTSDLYPQESTFKIEKQHAYQGEGFAWEQSRKLEPPK